MLFNISGFLLRSLLFLIGRLPLRFHRFNAVWIAFLLENVFRYRTGICLDNITKAFPEKSAGECLEIRHRFYLHMSRLFLEAIWFGSCTDPRRLRRSHIVEMENPEVLQHAYDTAPGVVVMSSHTGNWELFGGFANYDYKGVLDIPENDFCCVYRRMSDRVMDAVFARIRIAPVKDKKNFTGYQESKNVLRYMFRHRNEKKVYNFITDQRPYFDILNAPVIEFMNRPCRYMDASARAAAKFSYAVLYLSMKEKPEGGYTWKLTPICDNASEMTAGEICGRYYRLLEADLREQPYNYLWTHHRWWLG